MNDWEQILLENPKVLWGLIADVVKAIKAGEGDKKTGRRPAASVGSLDELYEILFQPYADAPFPEVFAKALGKRSQRAFAAQIGVNQATISRLLAGKTPPTVEMLERIAHTLNVRPTCFREYRAMKLGQVVSDVLMQNPDLSKDLCRKLVDAR